MNIVQAGNKWINLGLVAWAEQDGEGGLTLHFAVPIPGIVAGRVLEQGSTPPVASTHAELRLTGDEAQAVTMRLTALQANK